MYTRKPVEGREAKTEGIPSNLQLAALGCALLRPDPMQHMRSDNRIATEQRQDRSPCRSAGTALCARQWREQPPHPSAVGDEARHRWWLSIVPKPALLLGDGGRPPQRPVCVADMHVTVQSHTRVLPRLPKPRRKVAWDGAPARAPAVLRCEALHAGA